MITFSFQGSVRSCDKCKEKVPHFPSVLGFYKTYNWDWCQEFCPGLAGEIGGGSELIIVAETPSEGSAETPSFYKGEAYIQN